MPIRVLHVVTYMGRGGLETMIMNYYRQIDRDKVQFDFLVHRTFEADFDNEIIALGGNIYRLPVLNPFSPQYFHALEKFFSTHKYDIVHSHLDCLSAYPLSVAKKYGSKIRIAHAHNKNQDKNWKYIIKILSKFLMPYYATDLFACSEEAGAWMFPGRKFIVMKNAIDSKSFMYSNEKEKNVREKLNIANKFVVGHVGRFNPQKNHSFLLSVFKRVMDKEPNAVLLLVGSGDGQEEAKRKAQELGIDMNIMFLGNRDDVPEILQAVDVFVFPSLYEGLGIAAVEAQAAGIPCILSDQVPKECKLCSNVEFLSLKLSVQEWANAICQYRNHKKQDNHHIISEKGYDIKHNVKWLQDFYVRGGK